VFDLGWSEMGIVLLVALLVLGPKEMPKLARDLGRWTGKARTLAREFQRSLEDMAREAELDDVKKQIDEAGRELRRPQLNKRLEREIDPDGELGSAFDVDGERRSKTTRAGEPRPAPAEETAATVGGAETERAEGGERRPAPASSAAEER
jgi:sec-independent protein translocase protein TatB